MSQTVDPTATNNMLERVMHQTGKKEIKDRLELLDKTWRDPHKEFLSNNAAVKEDMCTLAHRLSDSAVFEFKFGKTKRMISAVESAYLSLIVGGPEQHLSSERMFCILAMEGDIRSLIDVVG